MEIKIFIININKGVLTDLKYKYSKLTITLKIKK